MTRPGSGRRFEPVSTPESAANDFFGKLNSMMKSSQLRWKLPKIHRSRIGLVFAYGLACLAFPFSALCGNPAALDQETGFCGAIFGMSPHQVGVAALAGQREGLEMGRRPGDQANFRGVVVEAVEYGFQNGRLGVIWLRVDDPKRASKLYRLLVQVYGKPKADPYRPWIREWAGTRNRIRFEVLDGEGRAKIRISGSKHSLMLFGGLRKVRRPRRGAADPALDPSRQQVKPQRDKYGYFSED